MRDVIEHLERQCGDEGTYTVVFRMSKWGRLRDRIVSKLEESRVVAGVFTKGRYREYDISIFPNARVLISGVRDEEELVNLISELIS